MNEIYVSTFFVRRRLAHTEPNEVNWSWAHRTIHLLCDEIERLRLAVAHAKYEARDEGDAANRGYGSLLADKNAEIDRLRAEIEFMRAWCADHFGGLMPPTREQNAALMRALDEMEKDNG